MFGFVVAQTSLFVLLSLFRSLARSLSLVLDFSSPYNKGLLSCMTTPSFLPALIDDEVDQCWCQGGIPFQQKEIK